MLATLLIGDLLGTWVVRDRIEAGMRREAANQAFLRARQVQSLYAERAATLQAESEAISLYPAVIAALVGKNPPPPRPRARQGGGRQRPRRSGTEPTRPAR